MLCVTVSRSSRAAVLDDFQDLALDDAPDSVEVGAASPLDFIRIHRLAPKPKKHRHRGEHHKPNRRDQIVPIAKKFSQRAKSLEASLQIPLMVRLEPRREPDKI